MPDTILTPAELAEIEARADEAERLRQGRESETFEVTACACYEDDVRALLAEVARLTASLATVTREKDAAVETIIRIDYQLEKHQTCAAMGNRQYAHGIRDARKIIADMLPACAENAEEMSK